MEIFFGDANNAEARVYARLDEAGLPSGCSLAGRVVGPTCEYSRTLSAAIPFTERRTPSIEGSRGTSPRLAEAIVPDPCFWSQELPFLYLAEIELRCGGERLAAVERQFGIRPLGARKRQIVWEARPWVLRAAETRELPMRPLSDWRAADLALISENPGDDLCREASRLGTVLIADVTVESDQVVDELRRLARWPAVVVAIVDSAQTVNAKARVVARNLLLAERLAGNSLPSPWADLVVCPGSSDEQITALGRQIAVPVAVERAAGWCDELADARRHCDLLQRDLAGHGDFAGYLV
ncbi:MAG TPA: hypothetical protein VHC22_30190 [Pirellulales bacterium]|nr:hypothetical protein [Pirellulales bacterium]